MGMTKRECLSVFILVLVNLLNYMDRFTIAGVLTDIQRHFQIDDAMAGLLQTVFIVAFMLVAPICGYLADRFNRKNIMIVGLLIWVSAVLGSTFIPSGVNRYFSCLKYVF
jgi:predicted MFS family arabinose efflux permease